MLQVIYFLILMNVVCDSWYMLNGRSFYYTEPYNNTHGWWWLLHYCVLFMKLCLYLWVVAYVANCYRCYVTSPCLCSSTLSRYYKNVKIIFDLFYNVVRLRIFVLWNILPCICKNFLSNQTNRLTKKRESSQIYLLCIYLATSYCNIKLPDDELDSVSKHEIYERKILQRLWTYTVYMLLFGWEYD